jgi:Lecithin:cholesterol acyltransferase
MCARVCAHSLLSNLCPSPSLRHCFSVAIPYRYGVNRNTERGYVYQLNPTTDPLEGMNLPITINTSATDPQSALANGIKLTDGDGTVPLVSLGYTCMSAWKHGTVYNPGNVTVITREYITLPSDIPAEVARAAARGGRDMLQAYFAAQEQDQPHIQANCQKSGASQGANHLHGNSVGESCRSPPQQHAPPGQAQQHPATDDASSAYTTIGVAPSGSLLEAIVRSPQSTDHVDIMYVYCSIFYQMYLVLCCLLTLHCYILSVPALVSSPLQW